MKTVRERVGRAAQLATATRRLIILIAVMLVAGASVIEVWPDPPGWLRPGRRADLRVLHWLDIHWLNAAAITAIATVAAALIPLYIWRHDRRQRQRPLSQQARERDKMLGRVRRKWITRKLEPYLEHAATLILGLQTRPDLVYIPKEPARDPGRQPEPVPEQKSILKIFDEAAGPLIIVGAPGAGKTTLLLQLAKALIDRAERDPLQGIPFVIELESWAAHRLALDKWLLVELTGSYNVPPNTAKDWVEAGELILLLDGLDEMEERHRAECVAAINDYQRDRGLNGLVVCSRTRELQQMTVKLEQLEEAVELQPLTGSQVTAFLDYLETTGTPVASVRAALTTDESLRELLSTPLMLNVVALAYNGQKPTALDQHGTLKEREEALWQAYVERMFKQRPLPRHCRYTREQALTWLSWLARALQENNQSEFQLDRLTSKWLPKKSERWPQLDLHVLLAEQHEEAPKMMEYGSILILFNAFGIALIKIFETLAAALYAGTGAGLAVGLIANPVAGLIAALATSFSTVLVSVPFHALEILASLISRRADQNQRPNEGTWRSARHALNTGLAAFLVFGGIAWLGFWLGFRPNLGLYFGLSLGLWFGWYYGMHSGGSIFIGHYAVRAALVRAGAAPWRYQAFLDAMAIRLLLRRSDGRYQFIHRLLRDYLARNPGGRTSGVQKAQ